MFYSGSVSPPRQPVLKKRMIPRNSATTTTMAGSDVKTPLGSPKKPSGGKGGYGASGNAKGEIVHVVHEIACVVNWPKLTKTNYTQWSLVMKIKLQARNLWEAIDPADVTMHEDRMALDAITSAVPDEMVAALAVKETALEAWNTVKDMRIGNESVRKAKAEQLRREFESIRFEDSEGVDDFVLRLQGLVAELGTVGETIELSKVAEKLLRVAPKRLSTVAVAIEVTMDLSKLIVEDVGGRLRAAEDRAAEDNEVALANTDGKLLLTIEQWDTRRQERRKKDREVERAHGVGGCKKKEGRGGGREDDSSDDDDGGSNIHSGVSGRRRSSGKGRCFNCCIRGHFSRECPKPRKEAAMFGNADEEPTLL
jgi:hypothetical protein